MDNVKRHADLLRALCTLPLEQRKALLKRANKSQVNCLSELALNLLNRRIPVSSTQRARLTRFKKQLRILGCRNASLKKRKRVLSQSGGAAFLPLLLNIALPVISSLVGSALNNG